MTERQVYSIKEFCEAYGLGRTTVWRLIKKGRIAAWHFGGRVLIPVHALAHIREGQCGTSRNTQRRDRHQFFLQPTFTLRRRMSEPTRTATKPQRQAIAAPRTSKSVGAPGTLRLLFTLPQNE